MTTVIRAAGAADFLALVPRLAGFVPSRSLVLVPFAGNRTAGAMRFDLPDPADVADIDRIASTFIGLVCKVAHTDAVAVVVYTDQPLHDGDAIAHDALVRAIASRADICGLRLSDALCVAADAWGSYLDPELPAAGRGLDEIPYDHEAFADLPVRGDHAAGAELPRSDLAETERVARALALLDDAIQRELASPDAEVRAFLAAAHTLDTLSASPETMAHLGAVTISDPPMLFERCLEWDPDALHPTRIATLLWCLSRPLLRDVALSQWPTDLATGDDAWEAQLEWAEGESRSAELLEDMDELSRMMCGTGPRPDPDRLKKALELCRRVAAASPRELRPGPLSACAWLAWALGRSTHAGRYAEAALQIDPAHGMSEIVLTMVSNAHLPEWAFAQPSPTTAPVTRLVDSRRVES